MLGEISCGHKVLGLVHVRGVLAFPWLSRWILAALVLSHLGYYLSRASKRNIFKAMPHHLVIVNAAEMLWELLNRFVLGKVCKTMDPKQQADARRHRFIASLSCPVE